MRADKLTNREQWLTHPSQDTIKPGIVPSETLKTQAGYAKTYAFRTAGSASRL